MISNLTRHHLRTTCSYACHYTGMNKLALKARQNCVTALCYHRVLDFDPSEHAYGDTAIVTSKHVFEHQMKLIKRNFNPITLKQMISWLKDGNNIPPRSVLITFDDGWSDTYTNAFPIMRELEIPGVVFLATGYTGTKMCYWTDRVREILTDKVGSEHASEEINKMKQMPMSKRASIIRNIESKYRNHNMTGENLFWWQAKEMASNGFEFGSHTRNHVILPNESDTTILNELKISAEDIQFHLNLRPLALAYPDGQYTDSTCRLTSQAQYECGFTCDEGLCTINTPRYSLPRLSIHDGICTTPSGSFSSAMFLTHIAGTIGWRYRRMQS